MFDDIKRLSKVPDDINIIGRIIKADHKNVVVIGSRNMSSYGRRVLQYLVPKLVRTGHTIISGLAPGCDSYAQKIALECGGRTIGVLGYGLDRISTDRNVSFIEEVLRADRGVIFSPFKRDQVPTRETFIYRNSIMAAIGRGVLVIEARRRSGVFHTVNFALELGKEVMAVPGSIFSFNSAGVHALLKEGAGLVGSFYDFADLME